MAKSVEEGAKSVGAETRTRKVRELAPRGRAARAEARMDDLEWADGYAFGTPTRFGGPAAQMKQFIDTTGKLRQADSCPQ